MGTMPKVRTRNKHKKRRRKSRRKKGGEYSNLAMKLFTRNSTGEPQDNSDKNNRLLAMVGPDLGREQQRKVMRNGSFSPLRKTATQYTEEKLNKVKNLSMFNEDEPLGSDLGPDGPYGISQIHEIFPLSGGRRKSRRKKGGEYSSLAKRLLRQKNYVEPNDGLSYRIWNEKHKKEEEKGEEGRFSPLRKTSSQHYTRSTLWI